MCFWFICSSVDHVQHSSALVAGNLNGQAAGVNITATNPLAVRRSIGTIGNDHGDIMEESTITLQNQPQPNEQTQVTEHSSAEEDDIEQATATVDSLLDPYTLPKKPHSSSVTTGM